MMSVPHVEQIVVAFRRPRLRLKPNEPISGYVDGGWWPRSRDLGVEVVGLAAGLAARLSPIRQVSYALDAWEPAPRHVDIDGSEDVSRPVRLVGFASQDPRVLLVTDVSGRTLNLLVVPPGTVAGLGDDALTRAARPGNLETPASLLAASGNRPAPSIPGPRPTRILDRVFERA